MNLVYLSSGTFGSLVLSNFKTKPNLVITQKDKIGGRGMNTRIPTPVKVYCEENKIPFIECSDRNDLFAQLSHNPLSDDPRNTLYVVCDIGMWIMKELREWADGHIINIHPSLLPLYRSFSPIQTALMDGDTETGVTVIQIDDKIDHGPILAQEKVQIDIADDTPALMAKLAPIAAALIERFRSLPHLHLPYKGRQGGVLVPQDHSLATFTKKLSKEDGFIEIDTLAPYLLPLFKKFNLTHLLPNTNSVSPLQVTGYTLYNKVRALQPWPTVWSTLSSKKVLKITKASFENNILLITECVIEGKKYKYI